MSQKLQPLVKHKGFCTVFLRRKLKNGKYAKPKLIALFKGNLLTNNGRDFFHAQIYTNTGAGTRGSGIQALSENTTPPNSADTTLAGEITTGQLNRVDSGVKVHTIGTNVTTLDHTFQASIAFAAVQKAALFNALAGGTMTHENTFTPTALNAGDQLQVIWTITLG